MKKFSVATCIIFFTLTGYATAQTYAWPQTDPDPYFKQRDTEVEWEKSRARPEPEYFQGDSE